MSSQSGTGSIAGGESILQQLSPDNVKLLNTKQHELNEKLIETILKVISEFRKSTQFSDGAVYAYANREHLNLCDKAEKRIQRWKQTALLVRYRIAWNEDLSKSGHCHYCGINVLNKYLAMHVKNLLNVNVHADQVNEMFKRKSSNEDIAEKPTVVKKRKCLSPISVDLMIPSEAVIPKKKIIKLFHKDDTLAQAIPPPPPSSIDEMFMEISNKLEDETPCIRQRVVAKPASVIVVEKKQVEKQALTSPNSIATHVGSFNGETLLGKEGDEKQAPASPMTENEIADDDNNASIGSSSAASNQKKYKTPEFVDTTTDSSSSTFEADEEKRQNVAIRKTTAQKNRKRTSSSCSSSSNKQAAVNTKKRKLPSKNKKVAVARSRRSTVKKPTRNVSSKRGKISKINSVLTWMDKAKEKQLKDCLKVVNLQRSCGKDENGKRKFHNFSASDLLQAYEQFRDDKEKRALQKRGVKNKIKQKLEKFKLPSNVMQTCTILYHLEACIKAQEYDKIKRNNAKKSNDELLSKFTRLSTSNIELLLAEIVQNGRISITIQLDGALKMFLLKCITCILFDLQNSLITLAISSKTNTIRPLEIGTLFNIKQEWGGSNPTKLPEDVFKHTNNLPTEDRILRILYQCLYVSLESRPKNVTEIIDRFMVEKDPKM